MARDIHLVSPAGEGFIQRAHLLDSFQVHPPVDELSAWLLRNFTGRGVPKSRPLAPVNVEIVISQAQARQGGLVQLEAPIPDVCAVCQGTGRCGSCACDLCDGEGCRWENRQVDVAVLAGSGDGSMIPVSLGALGVENLYLNLIVRVGQVQ